MENDKLWKLAEARIAFKRNLFIYAVVNLFLWIVWLFNNLTSEGPWSFPWPIYVMVGWGIGLFFNYMRTCGKVAHEEEVQREYDKLKSRQDKK